MKSPHISSTYLVLCSIWSGRSLNRNRSFLFNDVDTYAFALSPQLSPHLGSHPFYMTQPAHAYIHATARYRAHRPYREGLVLLTRHEVALVGENLRRGRPGSEKAKTDVQAVFAARHVACFAFRRRAI